MSKPAKVQFGKHKGKRWADVPKDYLEWMLRSFKERSSDWYQALAELQKREDEKAGYKRDAPKAPQKPHKARSKHKKRHKAHPPHVHSGANWKPPETPAMPLEERDRLFEELVDTSDGEVCYVERWGDVIPPPSKEIFSSRRKAQHPSKVWGDYEEYCSLERELSSVLRRNAEL